MTTSLAHDSSRGPNLSRLIAPRSVAVVGASPPPNPIGHQIVGTVTELGAGVTGVEADAAYGPARAGDARRSVVDASHAARELGWRPRVSLEDGLRTTWASTEEERRRRGRI